MEEKRPEKLNRIEAEEKGVKKVNIVMNAIREVNISYMVTNLITQ